MMDGKILKTKSAKSSKTIRIGALYISAGALIAILQVFDALESALTSIDIEGLSPNAAAWGWPSSGYYWRGPDMANW